MDQEAEFKAIRTELTQIRELVANYGASEKHSSEEFLLAEFNLLGELWRHTDGRNESALNYYLTMSALVVPALIVLSGQVEDARVVTFAAVFSSTALFAVGILILRRIWRTASFKAEYSQGLNLIRRYFVDVNGSIEGYIKLPLAPDPHTNPTQRSEEVHRGPSFGIVLVLRLWNATLLAFAVGATIWLLIPDASHWHIGVTAAILGAAAGYFQRLLVGGKGA